MQHRKRDEGKAWPPHIPAPATRPPKPAEGLFGRLFWPLLAASGLIIVLAALLIYGEFRTERELAQERLQAVSKLRQAQLDGWVVDLLGQGRFLSTSAYWGGLYLQAQAGDNASRKLLLQRLADWRHDHNSDSVLLLDASGAAVALEHPQSRETAPALQATTQVAIAQGKPVLTDVYRQPDEAIPDRVDIVIPLLHTGKPAQAVVVLRTDATRWLFPTLKQWPVPTASGETGLWRREGEQMRAMNELRHQNGRVASQLSFPLTQTTLPAARLARGVQAPGQVFEGDDYDNHRVLAIGQRIAGTGWWMSTEIDVDEVYAHARQSAWWIALGTATALSALAALARVGAQRDLRRQLALQAQHEQALRQAHDLLSLAERAASAGAWSWNIRAQTHHWFDEMMRLFGLDPRVDQGGYEAWVSRLHPEDRQLCEERLAEAIKVNQPFIHSYRIVLPSGKLRWIDASGHASYDDDGKPLQISGLCVDATQRRQAERERELDRERYRVLFTESHVPLVVMDPQSLQIVDCNAAAVAIYHLGDRSQVLGKTPMDLGAPRQYDGSLSSDAIRRINQHALQDGSITFNWLHQRPDGEQWDAEVWLTTIRHQGRVLFQCALRDITQERRTARELAEYQAHLEQRVAERTRELAEATEKIRVSEERLNFALEATHDGIFDWNLVNDKAVVNAAYRDMLGYHQDELSDDLQGLLVDLLPRPERDRLPQQLRERLARQGGYEVEFQLRRKDGNYCWILSRAQAVEHDAAGRPLRAVGTHVDLSERKKAEGLLRAARDAAESANRAKSAFLSNMSHELRTPLNAIMGMTYLLQAGKLGAEQQKQLKAVQSASSHLLGLIDDILNYTRMDAGTLDAQAQDFDLGGLLDTVSGRIHDKAAAKGLRLSVELAPELPRQLHGDASQVGQVLHKLADNAVKFTEAGTITLRARPIERRQDKVMLRFEVQDSGIGISAEQQSQLFQTFEQIDGSNTRRYGGTGLGLAIARRVVELMGGQIGVESEAGKGSLFWFTLSLGLGRQDQTDSDHDDDSATPTATPTASPAPQETPPDPQQWHALRQRLIALLQQDDTDCQALFQDNEALLRAVLGTRHEAVAEAMRNFDFAAALTALQEAP
jgi:PAS domain S-box-containing protein